MSDDNPTIVDIVDTLAQPIDYVCGVLGNMLICKRQHGSATVAIGKTGRGIVPNYRVCPDLQGDWRDKFDFQNEAFFKAYNGRSHRQAEEWGTWEQRDEHWSNRYMNFAEVQQLLGRLRGFRR
ncbi:hypothetical protein I6F15_04550 [Bradyrhizobium sp. BRP14]|nr:hypothetical protein [Bradyrhizobium sp. BRP14]